MTSKADSLKARLAAVGGGEAKTVPHMAKVRTSAPPQARMVKPSFPMTAGEREGLDSEARALSIRIPRGKDGKPVAGTHIVRALIRIYREGDPLGAGPGRLDHAALRAAVEEQVRRDRGVGE